MSKQIEAIESLLAEYDMINSAFAKDLREALAEQPAPVKPDETLLSFYQATDFPSLVSAMEGHIKKMQSKLQSNPHTAIDAWNNREMVRAAPLPAQQGVLARKWVLHGGFADVASFDAEGFPYFYWKESVAKFKAGELSTPCKGKNCGSLNGWLHSAECRAEHEAHYAVTKGNT